MSSGTHALVLGASMAGLAHAAALAGRFDRVTVVERDVIPHGAQPRGGVPQGRHVHLLLPAGLQGLEELLPGLAKALVAAGAHLVDAPEWRLYMHGGRLQLADTPLRIAAATRPLLESVVRERVVALRGVTLLEGWAARGLTATDDGTRATGVRLRSQVDPDDQRTLAADLVVDTTGRASPSPRWLKELGYAEPEEQRLQVGVHYATRLFRRNPADLGGCRHVMVDIPSGGRRGGVALAVEDGRWVVTLVGMLGERPPTDLPGFVSYAGSLWARDIHAAISGSEPIGDGALRAFPAYLRRRYDRLRRLPEGYVVSGDAVCSLNPVLAQGMSVAITEALLLGDVLDHHGVDDVGRRLLRRARPVVDDAWTMATGADLAHPEVAGPRPLSWRVVNAYLARLLSAAHQDPLVAASFIHAAGMVVRPQRLLRPGVVARVARARRTAGEPDHRLATVVPPPERSTHVHR